MATYRLFSYRNLIMAPDEVMDDENHFPWESVSQIPTILTEPKTVRIEEQIPDGDGFRTEVLEHTVDAGEIDPAWYEMQDCEHFIKLGILSQEDETEESQELEFFDDVDEDGTPFTNSREVTRNVFVNSYNRQYVLCCEHCTSYHLPTRFEARWEDVNLMSDQELRNLYEVSSRIDDVIAEEGDATQLNTLGLRQIDWANTVAFTSDATPQSNQPAAVVESADGNNSDQ